MTKTCRPQPRLFVLGCIAAALGFLFVTPHAARAQQVAVIVNGDPITTFDVEQRAKLVSLRHTRFRHARKCSTTSSTTS